MRIVAIILYIEILSFLIKLKKIITENIFLFPCLLQNSLNENCTYSFNYLNLFIEIQKSTLNRSVIDKKML